MSPPPQPEYNATGFIGTVTPIFDKHSRALTHQAINHHTKRLKQWLSEHDPGEHLHRRPLPITQRRIYEILEDILWIVRPGVFLKNVTPEQFFEICDFFWTAEQHSEHCESAHDYRYRFERDLPTYNVEESRRRRFSKLDDDPSVIHMSQERTSRTPTLSRWPFQPDDRPVLVFRRIDDDMVTRVSKLECAGRVADANIIVRESYMMAAWLITEHSPYDYEQDDTERQRPIGIDIKDSVYTKVTVMPKTWDPVETWRFRDDRNGFRGRHDYFSQVDAFMRVMDYIIARMGVVSWNTRNLESLWVPDDVRYIGYLDMNNR